MADGVIERVAMAPTGQVVHLVAHARGGVPVTLCSESADREPTPGVRLCQVCEVRLGELQEAADRIRAGAR
jgi:hypothetical protein